MKIYTTEFLENYYLTQEAKDLKRAGFINQEEYSIAKTKLLALNTNENLFVRIAFFVLGCFFYGSICSLISLFGIDGGEHFFKTAIFIFATIGFVLAYFVVNQNNFYGQGIDDAFILGSQLFLSIWVNWIFDSPILTLIIISIVATWSYFRYLHLYDVLIAVIAFVGLLAYGLFTYCVYGQLIIPFFLMLIAGSLIYCVQKLALINSKIYYSKALQLIKIIGLILLYLSSNYLVVRELSFEINGDNFETAPEISLSWLFYCFTILIPILYVILGLKNKDRSLLWIGLLSIVAMVFTIRHYHHLLPAEVALTVAGFVVFLGSVFVVKKLKTNSLPYTYEPDLFSNTVLAENIKIITTTTQFGLKTEVQSPESPMKFGGGGYSGGGSGGSF